MKVVQYLEASLELFYQVYTINETEEEEEAAIAVPTPEITADYVVYPPVNYPITKNAGGNVTLLLIDIDGTMVTSMSGELAEKDANDWIFFGPVPEKLNSYKEKGWTIALVSNQSEWSKKTDNIKSLNIGFGQPVVSARLGN
jgi:hypothetical protein